MLSRKEPASPAKPAMPAYWNQPDHARITHRDDANWKEIARARAAVNSRKGSIVVVSWDCSDGKKKTCFLRKMFHLHGTALIGGTVRNTLA